MQIIIKSDQQIAYIREAGKYLTEMLGLVRDASKTGVSLLELEAIATAYLRKNSIKGTFVGHHGYKHNLCLSVNDCVVHGIPDNYVLQDGDLLKIDAGVTYKGYIADAAICVIIGGSHTNPLAKQLVEATKGSLDTGLQYIGPGRSLYDYGYAVETYVKQSGCSILKQLTGHGVGTQLREPPYIYNRGHTDGQKTLFKTNMVVALEPITAITSTQYVERPAINKRNLYTQDGDLGAQWEYTLCITDNGYEILAGITDYRA